MTTVLGFIFSNKILVLFIVATTAFGISTIVLGVKNTNLRKELDEKRAETEPSTSSSTSSTSSTSTTSTTSTPSPEPPEDMQKYRLPTAVKPSTYDLYLYPDLDTGNFTGEVIVDVQIKEETSQIVMHSHTLDIISVQVDGVSSSFSMDPFYELLTITKTDGSKFSAVDSSTITVNYKGDMKGRIVGLYHSSYTNSDGDTRYMATSKFEPTYARQAFPCFDEPNLKSTYKVHLLKPDDDTYIALSNNPSSDNDEKVDEGIMVHFDETVSMSTYLSCFIVSDFQYTNTTIENGDVVTPFRVFASPEQLDKTEYAGEVGKKVIEYYIGYFDIPYPLPKLDLVAIPDFVSGAMEHWGLVTFRETALLYSSDTHSNSNKQRVAEVVAHELAHSWFGNLVTMDWWDNLWLNEGFASYIEVKGVHAVEPDWHMEEQFLIDTLHSVLSLDATLGSHPIIQTVTTPDQITAVFDSISYNKGASVLRMLEYVVGPDNFQKGVTNYLNKYAFGNAVTQNLWDEIQSVVGDNLNVTEFMDTFTVQMGYPIIEARTVGDTYVLTQKRFLKNYDATGEVTASPLNYKWSIPVSYVTDTKPDSHLEWFSYKDGQLVIQKPADIKWLKFNPNQVGYYRVNYPEDDWINLIANVGEMALADRTHLLEESFRIAESGELNYKIPLDLISYLADEEEYYLPWSVVSSQVQTIARYLESSEYYSNFTSHINDLLTKAYTTLGWDDSQVNESHLDKLARVVVLNLACVMNRDEALKEAKDYFDKWIQNPTETISPNLRTLTYKFGTTNADEATWNTLFDRFHEETDASEKLKLLNGLANVRNPALLTKLIELAKDETYVRGQDYFTLLQYISANPVGTPIVWDYVRENWNGLVDRFTLNNRYLGTLIPSITSRFSKKIKSLEMEDFFARYPNAGAGETARVQALETVANNIKWIEDHESEVVDWIKQTK